MYFCLCKGLTDTDVLSLVEAGHETRRALIGALGLRDPRCCGRCGQDVPRLLHLVGDKAGLTTAQRLGVLNTQREPTISSPGSTRPRTADSGSAP